MSHLGYWLQVWIGESHYHWMLAFTALQVMFLSSVLMSGNIYSRLNFLWMVSLLDCYLLRHNTVVFYGAFFFMFVLGMVYVCLPVWDQLDRRTRLTLGNEPSLPWLLESASLSRKTKVFRANAYAFVNGVAAIGATLWLFFYLMSLKKNNLL